MELEKSKKIVNLIIKNFNYYEITEIKVNLNNSATVSVNLLNLEPEVNGHRIRSFVQTLAIEISGEDYSNWGNDDSYVENYIHNYILNMPDSDS